MFPISKTHVAIPPGETIKEQLEINEMTQDELTEKLGLSEKQMSLLAAGQAELTADIADRLASVFKLPASFWTHLESNYREKLELVRQENKLI